MKTVNYTFQNNNLSTLIDFTLFENENNILVQIFCGHDANTLQLISNHIEQNLPQAICIGTTTDGEINNATVSTLKSIISISVFEETSINAFLIENDENDRKNDFDYGHTMAQNIATKESKLLITFTDGTSSNAENYLKGIESYNKNLMVCGGMAGDNGVFKQTHISLGSKVICKGFVAVTLNSEILQVNNAHKFDWIPIGIEHTIDKVKGNRIYEISGMSAQAFYEKYLGQSYVQAEYPLIVKRNNIDIARAVLTKNEDGSLNCAGNLFEGDVVRLGFANAQMLLQNPIDYISNINSFNSETFFIYSCMARRRYMQNLIKVEIEPFAAIAPTAGFFTYAEFYHNKDHNELLNQTLTLVSLSENPNKQNNTLQSPAQEIGYNQSSYIKTIQSLSNLVQQSTHDYQEQSKRLQEEKNYSQSLLHAQKQFLRHTVHETNTPLSVIMGNIDLYELEHGKNKYLSNIEVAMKNVFSIYDDLSYLVKKDQITYTKHQIDLVDFVRSRIDFFTPVAKQAHADFVFESTLTQMFIEFNDTKLQRIIDNNLTNAIKYTFENEDILITLKQEKNNYILSIATHSSIIQQPNKVFEEYYREESSQEGFGLGLNLVKRICEEEGVQIQLESNQYLTSFTYSFKGVGS